jgi:hexokinase
MRARLMTQPGNNSPEMEILVIDVGGTHVKMVRSTQMHEKRKFDSGKTLTPWQRMPPNALPRETFRLRPAQSDRRQRHPAGESATAST